MYLLKKEKESHSPPRVKSAIWGRYIGREACEACLAWRRKEEQEAAPTVTREHMELWPEGLFSTLTSCLSWWSGLIAILNLLHKGSNMRI